MRPKSILVVAQLPPPVHGSNVMAERFMSALGHNGYESRIVQKTFSRKMDEVGQASLSKMLRIPAHCYDLARSIRSFKPEICIYFITVGFTAFAVDALLIQLLVRSRIPYVLYFHGKGYRTYESGGKTIQRSVVKKVMRRALGGFVLGERLKSDVSCYIPEERLYVLPNGIPDIDRTCISHEEISEQVHVIFLSNLIKTKGPMEFLKMAKIVSEKTKSVRFSMIGRVVNEVFYKQLLDFIRKEGLSDIVTIPGALYGQAKEEMLKGADILVFPTYYEKETFGIVNLEAMQWGIPVISSREGAIPDVVMDGINGYIVDPRNTEELASKVVDLLGNPFKRKTMGRAGRNLYEQHYSIEAYERNVHRGIQYFGKYLDHN